MTSAALALAVAAALGLAACSSGSTASSSGGGKAVEGGTANFAEQPLQTPTYIFPLVSGADFSVENTALVLVGMALMAGPSGAASSGAGGMLPALPDGLNVAIGAHVSANSGSTPDTSLSNVNDGDGTTRWCPGTVGIHTVTIDLGRVVDVTGTGVTFSGEEGSDGSFYSVSTGVSSPGQTSFPNQAAGDRNARSEEHTS